MGALISVIVPVYNVKDFLDDCVQSIIKQSYHNLEIILIDDGSTDGSGDACDSYAENDSRIVVMHKKNAGLSAARNDGLDYCHGEFVTFVDSDDMLYEDSLQFMYNALMRTEAMLVQGLHTKEYHNTSAPVESVCCYSGKMCLEKDLLDTMACGKLYRKEVWDNRRFKEGILHEDFQIMYQVAYEIEKIAFLERTVYYIRERSGSITRSGYSDKHLVLLDIDRERIEYFRERQESLLLEHAYCDYYNHLLHFYCANKQAWIIKKYRENFKYFIRLKRVGIYVKFRLLICYFFPIFWR